MRKIIRPFQFIIITLVAVSILSAQDSGFSAYVPRLNYGAKLEIPDRIIHGAGQDAQGFEAYWQVLDKGKKPSMFMWYTQLRGNLRTDFANLRKTLQDYENKNYMYLMAQIGLAMTNDGSPETCYDEAVAIGTYDQAIETLCQCIADLGHPVLLRIGYEFNGRTWNGYHPEAYKKSFIKISKALRSHNLEAAAVWDAAGEIDSLNGLESYYPGDEWVDWWGINLQERKIQMKIYLSITWFSISCGRPRTIKSLYSLVNLPRGTLAPRKAKSVGIFGTRNTSVL
jgi:hypothetical protein